MYAPAAWLFSSSIRLASPDCDVGDRLMLRCVKGGVSSLLIGVLTGWDERFRGDKIASAPALPPLGLEEERGLTGPLDSILSSVPNPPCEYDL